MAERESFGSYRLVERIGVGGMGETWRARWAGPGTTYPVVIKRLLRHHAGDEALREALFQEARLMMLLSHPNIVRGLDFGEEDGERYLVLEHVNGHSLARMLERAKEEGLRGLPPPLVAWVGIEMLRGLGHAHALVGSDGRPLQLVHRDISADNVMLSFEGEVKLIDFGVAKAHLEGRPRTEPGVAKGKLRYFSPEQARTEPLDGRSDLWAVGLVLYLALSGRYASEHTAPARVLFELSTGRFPPLLAVAPWVPDALAAAISKALQPRKEDRHPDADAFAAALSAYLMQAAPSTSARDLAGVMAAWFDPKRSAGPPAPGPAPTQAEPPSVRQSPSPMPSASAPTRRLAAPAWSDVGRGRRLWVWGSIFGLGAGAVGVAQWLQAPDPSAPGGEAAGAAPMSIRAPPPPPAPPAPVPKPVAVRPEALDLASQQDEEARIKKIDAQLKALVEKRDDDGFLEVSMQSPIGQPVRIDGGPPRTLPIRKLRLRPGRHTLSYRSQTGSDQVAVPFTIVSGVTATFPFKENRSSSGGPRKPEAVARTINGYQSPRAGSPKSIGGLNIDRDVAGDYTIKVDGAIVDPSRRDFELTPGRHAIKATDSRGQGGDGSVEIKEGQTLFIVLSEILKMR